jgi:hypothetical protein
LWSASVLLNTDDEIFSAFEFNTRGSVVCAIVYPSNKRQNNEKATNPKTLGGLTTENLSRTPGKEGDHELEPAKFNPRAALATPATTKQICQHNHNGTESTTNGNEGLLLVGSSSLNICL